MSFASSVSNMAGLSVNGQPPPAATEDVRAGVEDALSRCSDLTRLLQGSSSFSSLHTEDFTSALKGLLCEVARHATWGAEAVLSCAAAAAADGPAPKAVQSSVMRGAALEDLASAVQASAGQLLDSAPHSRTSHHSLFKHCRAVACLGGLTGALAGVTSPSPRARHLEDRSLRTPKRGVTPPESPSTHDLSDGHPAHRRSGEARANVRLLVKRKVYAGKQVALHFEASKGLLRLELSWVQKGLALVERCFKTYGAPHNEIGPDVKYALLGAKLTLETRKQALARDILVASQLYADDRRVTDLRDDEKTLHRAFLTTSAQANATARVEQGKLSGVVGVGRQLTELMSKYHAATPLSPTSTQRTPPAPPPALHPAEAPAATHTSYCDIFAASSYSDAAQSCVALPTVSLADSFLAGSGIVHSALALRTPRGTPDGTPLTALLAPSDLPSPFGGAAGRLLSPAEPSASPSGRSHALLSCLASECELRALQAEGESVTERYFAARTHAASKNEASPESRLRMVNAALASEKAIDDMLRTVRLNTSSGSREIDAVAFASARKPFLKDVVLLPPATTPPSPDGYYYLRRRWADGFHPKGEPAAAGANGEAVAAESAAAGTPRTMHLVLEVYSEFVPLLRGQTMVLCLHALAGVVACHAVFPRLRSLRELAVWKGAVGRAHTGGVRRHNKHRWAVSKLLENQRTGFGAGGPAYPEAAPAANEANVHISSDPAVCAMRARGATAGSPRLASLAMQERRAGRKQAKLARTLRSARSQMLDLHA